MVNAVCGERSASVQMSLGEDADWCFLLSCAPAVTVTGPAVGVVVVVRLWSIFAGDSVLRGVYLLAGELGEAALDLGVKT